MLVSLPASPEHGQRDAHPSYSTQKCLVLTNPWGQETNDKYNETYGIGLVWGFDDI